MPSAPKKKKAKTTKKAASKGKSLRKKTRSTRTTTPPGEGSVRVLTPEVVGLSKNLPVLKQPSQRALSVTDPLTAYLQEIRRYPLLTKEHEQELAQRYFESGDAKA